MLLKICRSDLDETFKLNAESSFLLHCPREFIKLVGSGVYDWNDHTRNQVKKAFQQFSHEDLKQELRRSFKWGSYWKAGFICMALKQKEMDKEVTPSALRELLNSFKSPGEQILLRTLRYHLNERAFQEMN